MPFNLSQERAERVQVRWLILSGPPRTPKDDFDLYNDIWDSLGKIRRAQSKLQ
jgi:hypothetical protein